MVNKTNKKIFVISEECTIYDVSELKNQINELIENKVNIDFDLSEVTLIDASVIQLLLSSKIEMENNGLIFNLKNCSDIAKKFIENIYCDEVLFNSKLSSAVSQET